MLELGHAIAGRGECLVVLDNFEQVAEHVEETLGHWLDRVDQAAFAATSGAGILTCCPSATPFDLTLGPD